MVKLLRRALEWIEIFLVKARPRYVGLGLIVLGVLGFEGMVTYNQSSPFCMKCHEARGVYLSFDPDHDSHVPYTRDGVHCLACHTDKDFYSFAQNLVASSRKGFVRLTNAEVAHLPEPDPGYTDADCLICHHDVLKLAKAEKLELPPRLAEIGLDFSHQRHFWVKTYPAEAVERLAQLERSTERKKEEQDEYEFLLRARLGRCSQCHDRRQPLSDGETVVDRSINYFSINPMRCIGCHTDAVRGRHPGTIHLTLPREETCRRCHTGTFHGRFTIFRAECEGEDRRHCRRCHSNFAPTNEPIDAAMLVAQQP